MKGFKVYKTIQLILCMAVAAAGVYFAMTDSELSHLIANNRSVMIMTMALWVLLVIAFFFIVLDYGSFAKIAKNIRELDYSVHADPTTGLANRYSCDMIIEKYLDKQLPKNIGCIMFDIINIQDINRKFGHIVGNTVIKDFSNILLAASEGVCFVGRNGGNKFMAIFESYSNDSINSFLADVEKKVIEHNAAPGAYPIEYKKGVALAGESTANMITELIAEANKKIYDEKPSA